MQTNKPTKNTLNREYILTTALNLIDKDSLEKFSMRRLGQEMGVSQMAVYRYFDNQGVLFDALLGNIWAEALSTEQPSLKDTWQATLIHLMSQLRQTLLRHPNLLPLIATHPLVTPEEFKLVEKILVALKQQDLKIQSTTVFLINALTSYTIGSVWAEVVEPVDGGKIDSQVLQQTLMNSPLLTELLSPIQNHEYSSDEQFLMGLESMITGWK